VRIELGFRRGTPRVVGSRALTVVAWQLGLSWRGPRGGGAWCLVRPVALLDGPASAAGDGRARWRLVPDCSALAWVAALGLLAWLAWGVAERAGGRR
jgi:hypothetical protein